MHSKEQLQDLLFGTILHAAMVMLVMAIVLVLAVVPTWAQNAVPPTAREAASIPAFASRLHPPATQATKSPAPARNRSGPASPQDQLIYENGPVNGTTDAWTINFGYVVSDTFAPNGSTVSGFDIWVWEFPGDVMTSVDWSITDSPNGGTVYGSGTANVSDQFISTNQYGYNIDKISVTGLGVSASGTVWVNLFNATVPSGDPVYWDENSGAGCHSSGCPSQAVESEVGTIPSEAFDMTGAVVVNECIYDDPQHGFTIIHNFTGQESGGAAEAVVADPAGNLYGPTGGGGNYGQGMVYELAQKAGGWLFNSLYSFTGSSDGGDPGPVILGPDGALYGGAANGGIQRCGNGTSYCGLVYRLRPSPVACLTALCSWSEEVLYQFSGNTDAWGGQVSGFDQAGNLYGFSAQGGAYGHGAIFQLTPFAAGWTEKVVYSFTPSDGAYPNSLLVGSDGNLYGTTYVPPNGGGILFQLLPSGGGWIEQVIARFGACNYYDTCPRSLVLERSGSFYGLSSYDEYLCDDSDHPDYCYWDMFGQIFEMYQIGGRWYVSVLDDRADYYWRNGMDEDGYDLFYDLAIDEAGHIYGAEGGWHTGGEDVYWGNILELPAPFQDKSLVSFSGNHFANLAVDPSGNLYGTTPYCGKYNGGTVWQLIPQQ